MFIPPWSLGENGTNSATPHVNQVQLVAFPVSDLQVVEGLCLG